MTVEDAGSPEGAAACVLEVTGAAVHFGGVKAVDGVTLGITPGRIFGILGPNGSGKSTLLAAMTRFVDLTAGSMKLQGREYHTVPTADVARRGVARTFQTVRLLAGLTVLENVQLGADHVNGGRPRVSRRAGRGGVDNDDRLVANARRAMERTGLTGLERRRPNELSYGVQRRVEIARAIAAQPELLLLDEPTAGMNQSERREISQLLKELRDEGLTQLLVEHDVQMMVDTCDWLFAMNFGKLIAQGTPESVVRESAVREAYLGKKWSQSA